MLWFAGATILNRGRSQLFGNRAPSCGSNKHGPPPPPPAVENTLAALLGTFPSLIAVVGKSVHVPLQMVVPLVPPVPVPVEFPDPLLAPPPVDAPCLTPAQASVAKHKDPRTNRRR
jgi:hypothetical protein